MSTVPRVFKALAQFFGLLEKNDASLKANLPDRQRSFDRAGVSRAYKRITDTSVRIEPVTWVGTLVGLSPIRRTFDFEQDGTQEIISGKFSHQVSQDYLERIEGDEGILSAISSWRRSRLAQLESQMAQQV